MKKPTLRTALAEAPEEFRPILKLLRKLDKSQKQLQKIINRNDESKK